MVLFCCPEDESNDFGDPLAFLQVPLSGQSSTLFNTLVYDQIPTKLTTNNWKIMAMLKKKKKRFYIYAQYVISAARGLPVNTITKDGV